MQVAALLFWINQPSMPKAALLEDIRKAGASLLPSCSARYRLQGMISPTPTCKQRQICALLSALEYFLSGHGVDRLAHCLAFLSQLFLHLFKGAEGGRLPAQSCSLLSFSFLFSSSLLISFGGWRFLYYVFCLSLSGEAAVFACLLFTCMGHCLSCVNTAFSLCGSPAFCSYSISFTSLCPIFLSRSLRTAVPSPVSQRY